REDPGTVSNIEYLLGRVERAQATQHLPSLQRIERVGRTPPFKPEGNHATSKFDLPRKSNNPAAAASRRFLVVAWRNGTTLTAGEAPRSPTSPPSTSLRGGQAARA